MKEEINKSKKSIIRSGVFLLLSTKVGDAANFVFQVIMARQLTTEDFGTMNAALSILVIVGILSTTISTIITKYVAQFKAQEEYGKITHFFYFLLKKITIFTSIGFIFFLLFSGRLSNFLNIKSRWPIIIVGFLLAVSFILPLNYGTLQGLQLFGYLGFNSSLSGVLKLVIGILMVWIFRFGVNGALASGFFATCIVFFSSYLCLKPSLLKVQETNINYENITSDILKYSLPVLVAYIPFSIMTTSDLLLVKHFFNPNEAGYYATAVVLGRIVLFLSGTFVMALFPMVVEQHVQEGNTFSLLLKGLGCGILFCGTSALIYWFFSNIIIRLVLGVENIHVASLLKIFGVAMIPYALVNIIMNYNLAKHRFNFVYPMILCAILQIVLIYYRFHEKTTHVIYVMGINGSLLLVFVLLFTYLEVRNEELGE
ncbi:MAG: oligosaccharide flippase family protein [bacterium]